ncbi:MAG: WecB/TagA/CpsF family glycosyltransferase, partial [Halanaerobiales bacterium]
MSNNIKILGIKVNKVNMREAIKEVRKFLVKKKKAYIVTPNSEIIVMAQEDKELAGIINNSDLSIADGAGVVFPSKFYKKPLTERVAGFDLMSELLKLSAEDNYSIYFLGGEKGVVDKVKDNIIGLYPEIKICGIHHGFLDKEKEELVLNDISKLKPDILFIGMGVPRQEKFIYRNYSKIKANVIMTVGGSFDILAGRSKRAPLWMQKLSLEWF